jgi:thymidylate kinase
MGAAATAAAIVDAAASSPVLVVGSMPPEGRDLDLLIDASDRPAVAEALERNGFERHGDSWVHFGGLSAYAVDLVPSGEWRLDEEARRELFERARPIGAFRSLVRPSPAHTLLVLARKLAGERGPLREKHRRRIDEELAADTGAWRAAHADAQAWRLERELEELRGRMRGGGRRHVIHRPRRGAIVGFSGLDGSGKSSQVRALADALGRLGWETETVWVPLGSSAALQRVAGAGKRAIARARGADGGSAAGERLLSNPGGERGDRRSAVAAAAAAWSTAGAAANALAHLRAAAGPIATGKVVIFDRYVLDTIVHLRFTYGGVPHPAQESLVRLLSPAPAASFFLDVPPEVALSRKQDWGLPVLERQAELYRAEHARLGVRRLDGERPQEELAAEIARDVWRRLR